MARRRTQRRGHRVLHRARHQPQNLLPNPETSPHRRASGGVGTALPTPENLTQRHDRGAERSGCRGEGLPGRHRRPGLPQRLLSDNGEALNPIRRGMTSELVAYANSLGVATITGKPFKPTTQGKKERFHSTLFKWLKKQPFTGRAAILVINHPW